MSFLLDQRPYRSYSSSAIGVLVCAALLIASFQSVARGAALSLYETGAPDLGTASAGRAAMAADASTAAANPAGMTLLDRSQLLSASGAMLPTTNFDIAPQTTTKGTSGGNAGVFMPLGGFFYAHKLTSRFWLGVALYSDYGLGVNYSKEWVGRYHVTRVALFTGKISPSLAYQVNEWLSVAAGFSFAVGRLTFQSKINNQLPPKGDGNFSLESWDEAFGGHAGIMLMPLPKLRIGLTYQSPEYYKFGFNPHLSDLGPGLSALQRRIGGSKINIPLEEPQQVMASARYQILPNWSLLGNVGWQNWSAFGEFPVGVTTSTTQKTVAANLHFSDTCQIAIGQQLRVGEKWLWSAGFAYDSAPVSKVNRNPVLPIDRQLRYGTGIQYELNHDVTVGAAWEFMDAGPAPYSSTRSAPPPLKPSTLQGHFSSNYLNFLALNIGWKF